MNIKILGERIRIARERLGLSQTQLGQLVSRDQRAISEYEHGERRISATDLPAFAEALDVPLLYFFDGEITPQDREYLIVDEFRKLPNEQAREDAIQLLQWFVTTLKKQNDI